MVNPRGAARHHHHRRATRSGPARALILCGVSAAGLLGALGALQTASASPLAAGPLATTTRAAVSPATTADIVTYDYNNSRSGHDPAHRAIAELSTKPAWDDNALDGAVYGQPLVFGGTVFVATENDTLYAITEASGAIAWKLHVGTAVSTSVIDSAPGVGSGCGDINPLGITGTPVIAPTTNEIFLAEETELPGRTGWRNVRHWLVAVSLTTHRALWHRDIDPPSANNPASYYIVAEQERSAITLSNGRVYVPFGGLYGDCGQYHGYVVEVAASGTGALESYQVPTEREGGIWGTSGIVVSSAGDLYVATGNGSSNSIAKFDEGNSVIDLSPSLARLGVWAPSNWVDLNDQDWDLGSAGPIQVPRTSLLFVAGKPSDGGAFGYLMTEGHLGGIGHGAFTGLVCQSGGVFGADASDVLGSGRTAETFVYAPCGGGTEAVQISTSPLSFHRVWSPSTGDPNGPPIVAGGLVWAVDWNSGRLYGMNPATGAVRIERSTDPLNHFATVSVAGRMLLVPTQHGVEAFRSTA